jgi:hypothetical protein
MPLLNLYLVFQNFINLNENIIIKIISDKNIVNTLQLQRKIYYLTLSILYCKIYIILFYFKYKKIYRCII